VGDEGLPKLRYDDALGGCSLQKSLLCQAVFFISKRLHQQAFDTYGNKKSRNQSFDFFVGDEGFEPPTPSV
jgi:hypothetical protein